MTDNDEKTREMCHAHHGDWTGTHVRISSCPEPEPEVTTVSVTTLRVEVKNVGDGHWYDMDGFAGDEKNPDEFWKGYRTLKELSEVRAIRETVTQTITREMLDV